VKKLRDGGAGDAAGRAMREALALACRKPLPTPPRTPSRPSSSAPSLPVLPLRHPTKPVTARIPTPRDRRPRAPSSSTTLPVAKRVRTAASCKIRLLTARLVCHILDPHMAAADPKFYPTT